MIDASKHPDQAPDSHVVAYYIAKGDWITARFTRFFMTVKR